MTRRSVRRVNPGIIYGPVHSRRFGISLGINISGKNKYCSFDCLYCFRGRNDGRPDNKDYASGLPSADMVVDTLRRYLDSTIGDFDDLTIAGNAEPTDHPAFAEIVDRIVELRRNLSRWVHITVLTNGMGLLPGLNPRWKEVKAALEKIDQSCIKLDSGIPETWRKISRPYRNVRFHEWFTGVQSLSRPVIQTMLVRGRVDNTTQDELVHLKKCCETLSPKKIQVLTINKPPSDSGIIPVDRDEMDKIQKYLSSCYMKK